MVGLNNCFETVLTRLRYWKKEISQKTCFFSHECFQDLQLQFRDNIFKKLELRFRVDIHFDSY